MLAGKSVKERNRGNQNKYSPRDQSSEADHSITFILRPGVRQISESSSSGPILSRGSVWMSYCAPSVAFAALAARAFARFATSAAFRAGDSFFFAISFFSAGFFA